MPSAPMTGASRARLGANECPLAPSTRVLEAIAVAAGTAERYPDADGSALKARIAAAFGLTPEHVALGNGASELIDLALAALVRPDDEVVICEPTFPLYRARGTIARARIVAVPGREHAHDLEAMVAAVTPRTRLVVVVNPNNPTGTLVRRAAWSAFLDALPPALAVLCDEAYLDYVEDADAPDTLADVRAGRPVISLRTFSKAHALAGLRAGYALADPATARRLEALRPRFSVNALAQAAACAALDEDPRGLRARALVNAGKAELARGLERLGARVHPSYANFVLVQFPDARRDLCAALAGQGVEVCDLRAFGMAHGWVRVTVGLPAEHERLFAALAEILPGSPAGEA